MRKLSVVVWVKKHEPGLLSIVENTPKSLVPLVGGVRIIDLCLGPLCLLGLRGVTVVLDDEMAAAKEYLIHKYSAGRIRVQCEHDASAALSGLLKNKRNDPLLLLQVNDVLFADWARLVPALSEHSDGNYEIVTKRKDRVGVFIARREELAEPVASMAKRAGMDEVWDEFETVLNRKMKAVTIEASFFEIRNVYDYYRLLMEINRNLEKHAQALFTAPYEDGKEENAAQVLESGYVKNSHVSSSCVVEGYVEGCVLLPHVRVGKGARVTDSIVMSNNYVGEGAIVQNAVLCENGTLSKVTPNIGVGSRIGEDDTSGANGRYPEFIRGGITVVGENVEIPKGIRIARNCYIPSETDRALFKGRDRIKAGDTVEAHNKPASHE